jgi:renalase
MDKRAATDVLIVGAGLGGLAAARDLTRAGFSVRILEKSRGVSGRAATKQLENGVIVDHGAPYFTARGERLQAWVEQLQTRGELIEWARGFATWRGGRIEPSNDGHARYSFPKGMNSFGKLLRDGIDSHDAPLHISTESLVSAVWANNLGYRAVLENGEIYTGRAVLVNAPAPQALALTRSSLEAQAFNALERVKFAPCWSVLVELERAPHVSYQAIRFEHDVLSWASLEHTKRTATSSATLVLHANAVWSEAHLEQNHDFVIPLILEAARATLGDWVKPNQVVAHRWRYANAVQPHPDAFLAQDSLVFCGDWCAPNGNARIETALESGWAAATYLEKQLEQPLERILTGV